MLSGVPQEIITEIDISFAIATEIEVLMRDKGLTKKQFSDALGKRPSEVTKWLSGQRNFTIRILALISGFFGQPLIHTATHRYTLPEDEQPTMAAESLHGVR